MQAVIIAIFLILCVSICACSSDIRNKKDNDNLILIEYKTSASLKGLAILTVFIHHYGQLTSEYYNNHTFIGYLGVTIFLFIAGYTSQKQLLIKGKTYVSSRFLLKKFVRLYIPFVIVNILVGIFRQDTIRRIIASIVHIEDDWFLIAISSFYIIFFVANQFSDRYGKNKCILFIFIAILIYTAVCRSIGLPYVWYNTAFAFLLGIIFSNCEESVMRFKDMGVLKIGIVILCTVFCYITSVRLFLPEVTSLGLSISFSFLLVLFVKNFTVSSKLMQIIGGISWEFYLFHSKILTLTGKWLESHYVLYVFVAAMLSFLLAYMLNKLMNITSDKIIRYFKS